MGLPFPSSSPGAATAASLSRVESVAGVLACLGSHLPLFLASVIRSFTESAELQSRLAEAEACSRDLAAKIVVTETQVQVASIFLMSPTHLYL